jgi:hypothetical protein
MASLEDLPRELLDYVLADLFQGPTAKEDFNALQLTSRTLATNTFHKLLKQLESRPRGSVKNGLPIELSTAGVMKLAHIVKRGAAHALKYTILHPPQLCEMDGWEYEWVRTGLWKSLEALPLGRVNVAPIPGDLDSKIVLRMALSAVPFSQYLKPDCATAECKEFD